MYDVIIIGAGPSGLMAAYQLKNKSVLVIDKNSEIGGKLKVSGGGRCNVTNLKSNEELLNYIPQNNKFLYSTLNNFNSYDIYDFFIKNNVALKEEDHNRIFPQTNKSETIIKTFKHIKTLLNYTVSSVTFASETFTINDSLKCKNLIIATGGMTFPHLGTTGDGYEFAKKFNHSITRLFPCEVALVSNDEIIAEKTFQGITLIDADVFLYKNDKQIFNINQNILFTHFGLSGPAALNCSYYINKDPQFDYYLKVIPNGIIPKKIKKYLDENEEIKINIHSTRGFKTAFVTGGGVDVKEVNPKTFESKLQKNLYFIGEVLDINAFTGGYNLTTCFSEGYSCAQAINNK